MFMASPNNIGNIVVELSCVEVCLFHFQTFLSHKYGYRPLPRTLEAEEFEKITQGVEGEDMEIIDR